MSHAARKSSCAAPCADWRGGLTTFAVFTGGLVMAQQHPLNAELLYRPGMRGKRAQRRPSGMKERAYAFLRSFSLKRSVMAALGGAVIAALIWALTPSPGGQALADLLKAQGYWEIAAP